MNFIGALNVVVLLLLLIAYSETYSGNTNSSILFAGKKVFYKIYNGSHQSLDPGLYNSYDPVLDGNPLVNNISEDGMHHFLVIGPNANKSTGVVTKTWSGPIYTGFTPEPMGDNSTNSTVLTGCAVEDSDAFFLAVKIVQGYILPIIELIGILTNVMNLVVLTRPNMRSATNVFLIGISISDSILLVIIATYYIRFSSVPEKPINKDCYLQGISLPWQFYYKTWYMWANIFLTVTNWLIMGVTIFRFIAVCFPMHAVRLCTSTRARAGVALAVFFAVCLNLPDFFTISVVAESQLNSSELTFRIKSSSLYNDTTFIKIYYDLKIVLNILIPWATCCVLTAKLICTLRNRSEELKKLSESERMHSTTSKMQKRISIMLIVLNVWFLVCQLPSVVWYFLVLTRGRNYIENISQVARILRSLFADTFLTLNYSANFFLYSASNRQYRNTFRRLWTKKGSRRNSLYGGTTMEMKTTTTSATDTARRTVQFKKNGFVKIPNVDF